MPLLRRQPFAKQRPPSGVKPDDEVFFCRLTGEVFDDYEKFFERIILCNSLVWTCEITGKSGLTFQEAMESEEKALKQLASFPAYLQKPILYLASLTHRPRLNDLNDDVFTYVKDRYFNGESVDVVHEGEKKSCTVLQAMVSSASSKSPKKTPTKPVSNGKADSGSDSDVICLDDPVPQQKSPKKTPAPSPKAAKSVKKGGAPEKPIAPEKFQYVVQDDKKSNIYIVKADQVSRKKGIYTRDKSKLFLKQHCESSGDGIWRVKAKHLKKFKIAEMRFADISEGSAPKFTVAHSKKKPAAKHTSSAVIDLTDEDAAIRKAKKEYKEKKRKEKKKDKEAPKGEKKKKKDLDCTSKESSHDRYSPKSHKTNNRKKGLIEDPKIRKITDFIAVQSKSEGFILNENNLKNSARTSKSECLNSEAASDKCYADILEAAAQETIDVKPVKLTPEERVALKEQEKAARLADKLAKKEEMKKVLEEERQKKKEERDKLRLLKLEEKIRREKIIKEWSRPREDMDCDDLKDIPLPTPINCLFPTELFGDILMVLEYMTCFRSLFDFEDEFPQGIDLDELGKALMSTDTTNLFADILRVLLTAVFNLQAEEDEDDDEAEDKTTDAIIKDMEEGNSLSYKQLVNSATAAAQWPSLHLGASLKKLQLDNFTITEIVRLHFLASGSQASEKSAKFRYQERGGYTSYDDAGLEFRKEEPAVLQTLAETNIFDLPPADKLKVLTALINQLLTFVTSRDFIEDNFERLRQMRNDLRQVQMEEQRRDRDEATFWYKKRLEDRQKEKEVEAERKAQKKKEKEDKLRAEEGSPSKPIDLDKEEPEKKANKSSPMDASKDIERKSARQKAILIAKEESEDLPVENIDWEKITPDERIRMKDRYIKREKELMDLVQELVHCNAICCLGRDRTFRRYWVFQSVPGLFIEDQEDHIIDDILKPVDQTGISNPFMQIEDSAKDKSILTDDKCTSSDKENESFDGSSNIKQSEKITDSGSDDIKKIEVDTDLVYETVHQQIANRNTVKWAYFCTPEQLDKLISSLNPRGYREGPLKQCLLEHKHIIAGSLDQCPTSILSLPQSDEDKNKASNAVNVKVKSRNKTTQGTVQNGSAQEFLELNLRESLLDIEERIYVGTLGAMKVSSRDKWRDAIENGSFDLQAGELKWSLKPENYASPVKGRVANDDVSMDTDEDASPVVRDLAKALLQISQSIETKYVGAPLGKATANLGKKKTAKQQAASKSKNAKSKGKNKEESDSDDDTKGSDDEGENKQPTSRDRWESSLMSVRSLPQIFLHLSVLEGSILWGKSALHARCRLCRRKGDGEHMLLCDGCDRGHHMYCLKPAVKKVPQGDWFCNDCKPKEVPRTPRKRRKSFVEEPEEEESDEEEAEESGEEAESSEDGSSDSNEESEDSDDDEEEESDDDESDEESEEEEKPVKIKFIKRNLKKQPSSGRSTPTSESRKGLRASASSSSLLNGRGNAKASGRNSARNSLEPPKSKVSRKSLETTKGRRSQEPEKPINKQHLQAKGMRASRSTSSLTDMSKAGSKRKADKHEDTPEPKRSHSSKRGGENIHQMKLLEDLLTELCEKKEAWPFLTPVTKRDAPDYFNIVRKPMDFRTIRSKILKIEYLQPGPIIEDIRLTFQNCEQYNMQTVPEYSAGQKMARYFEKRLKELKLDQFATKSQSNESPSPKKKQRRI